MADSTRGVGFDGVRRPLICIGVGDFSDTHPRAHLYMMGSCSTLIQFPISSFVEHFSLQVSTLFTLFVLALHQRRLSFHFIYLSVTIV